jgi:hypothetical protein
MKCKCSQTSERSILSIFLALVGYADDEDSDHISAQDLVRGSPSSISGFQSISHISIGAILRKWAFYAREPERDGWTSIVGWYVHIYFLKRLTYEPPEQHRLKNITSAKSLKSQIMATIRKPVQSRNVSASSSRTDPVVFATAQLQGTSLVRERPKGSSSTTEDEKNALRTTLMPAAIDEKDWGIPPAKTQTYEPELQVCTTPIRRRMILISRP